MSSVNIRLDIAYDGTDFAGWQIQKNERTVQSVIEDALRKIHDEKINITAAGRTDSGVHAKQQVANFKLNNRKLEPYKYKDALNYYLPEDVRILKSMEVPGNFSARFSARIRVYMYYIYCSCNPYPHYRRYCYWIRNKPDLKKLNRISSALIGEHDYSVFAASGDNSNSKVKNIFCSSFFLEGPFILYRIAAGSFLYRMVRSIVGTILDLEKKGLSEKEMIKILESGNRENAGKTVPSRGLFLEKVIYEGEENSIF